MVDIEMSFWIQQRIKQYVHQCIDQGHQLNMRCFICGDSRKNKLKKRGYYYKNTCSYYCFNCNATLLGLKIVSQLENRPYRDIKLEYLQDKYGRKFKTEDLRFDKQEKQKIILDGFTSNLPADAFSYLRNRKIFEAPFLYPEYEFMWNPERNRLVIPWYYNEEIIYYQERYINNKIYVFPKLEKTVFNIDMVDPSFPYIFIMEGVFDCIFVRNGVAIGGGNLTDFQKKMIRERWPNHKLVYFFDNHYLEKDTFEKLEKLVKNEPSALFLPWPRPMHQVKDVNKWIELGGRNIFSSRQWLEQNTLSSLKMKFHLSDINKERKIKRKYA